MYADKKTLVVSSKKSRKVFKLSLKGVEEMSMNKSFFISGVLVTLVLMNLTYQNCGRDAAPRVKSTQPQKTEVENKLPELKDRILLTFFRQKGTAAPKEKGQFQLVSGLMEEQETNSLPDAQATFEQTSVIKQYEESTGCAGLVAGAGGMCRVTPTNSSSQRQVIQRLAALPNQSNFEDAHNLKVALERNGQSTEAVDRALSQATNRLSSTFKEGSLLDQARAIAANTDLTTSSLIGKAVTFGSGDEAKLTGNFSLAPSETKFLGEGVAPVGGEVHVSGGVAGYNSGDLINERLAGGAEFSFSGYLPQSKDDLPPACTDLELSFGSTKDDLASVPSASSFTSGTSTNGDGITFEGSINKFNKEEQKAMDHYTTAAENLRHTREKLADIEQSDSGCDVVQCPRLREDIKTEEGLLREAQLAAQSAIKTRIPDQGEVTPISKHLNQLPPMLQKQFKEHPITRLNGQINVQNLQALPGVDATIKVKGDAYNAKATGTGTTPVGKVQATATTDYTRTRANATLEGKNLSGRVNATINNSTGTTIYRASGNYDGTEVTTKGRGSIKDKTAQGTLGVANREEGLQGSGNYKVNAESGATSFNFGGSGKGTTVTATGSGNIQDKTGSSTISATHTESGTTGDATVSIEGNDVTYSGSGGNKEWTANMSGEGDADKMTTDGTVTVEHHESGAKATANFHADGIDKSGIYDITAEGKGAKVRVEGSAQANGLTTQGTITGSHAESGMKGNGSFNADGVKMTGYYTFDAKGNGIFVSTSGDVDLEDKTVEGKITGTHEGTKGSGGGTYTYNHDTKEATYNVSGGAAGVTGTGIATGDVTAQSEEYGVDVTGTYTGNKETKKADVEIGGVAHGFTVAAKGEVDIEDKTSEGTISATSADGGIGASGEYKARYEQKTAGMVGQVHLGPIRATDAFVGTDLSNGNKVVVGNFEMGGTSFDGAALMTPNEDGTITTTIQVEDLPDQLNQSRQELLDNFLANPTAVTSQVREDISITTDNMEELGSAGNIADIGWQAAKANPGVALGAGSGMAGDWVSDTASDVGDWTSEKAGAAVDWTSEKASQAGEWASETATEAKEYASEKATEAGEAVSSAWSSTKEAAAETWKSNVVNPMTAKWAAAQSSVDSFLSGATSRFEQLKSGFFSSDDPTDQAAEVQTVAQNIKSAEHAKEQINNMGYALQHRTDQNEVALLETPVRAKAKPEPSVKPVPTPTPLRKPSATPVPEPRRNPNYAPVPVPEPRRKASLVQAQNETENMNGFDTCFRSEAFFLASNVIMYLNNGVDQCGDIVVVMAQETRTGHKVNVSASFRKLGEFTQKNGAHWIIRKIDWVQKGMVKAKVKALPAHKIYDNNKDTMNLLVSAISSIKAYSLPYSRYVATEQCRLYKEAGLSDSAEICKHADTLVAWEQVQSAVYIDYLQHVNINLDFLK